MTELERQLATLLKDAPGEPPTILHLDAIRHPTRARRRRLAPLAAATVVLLLAVSAVILVGHGTPAVTPPSHATPARSHAHSTEPGPRRSVNAAPDPHEVAIRTAEGIIDSAPIVPGATRRTSAPLPFLNEPTSTPGAQNVQLTRFWVAAGSVNATIAYLNAHRPAGLSASGVGHLGGPGIPVNGSLSFQTAAEASLDYTVVAYRGGVAIRADVQVLWAPARSPADTIPPTAVTAVDVLVVRQNPQLHQGAPTVRRTLTGAKARQLASYVDGIPIAIPAIYRCAVVIVGERWLDRLIVHSPSGTATVVVDMVGCSSTTFQVGKRKPIELSAVGDVDHTILAAAGLPDTYGR